MAATQGQEVHLVAAGTASLLGLDTRPGHSWVRPLLDVMGQIYGVPVNELPKTLADKGILSLKKYEDIKVKMEAGTYNAVGMFARHGDRKVVDTAWDLQPESPTLEVACAFYFAHVRWDMTAPTIQADLRAEQDAMARPVGVGFTATPVSSMTKPIMEGPSLRVSLRGKPDGQGRTREGVAVTREYKHYNAHHPMKLADLLQLLGYLEIQGRSVGLLEYGTKAGIKARIEIEREPFRELMAYILEESKTIVSGLSRATTPRAIRKLITSFYSRAAIQARWRRSLQLVVAASSAKAPWLSLQIPSRFATAGERQQAQRTLFTSIWPELSLSSKSDWLERYERSNNAGAAGTGARRGEARGRRRPQRKGDPLYVDKCSGTVQTWLDSYLGAGRLPSSRGGKWVSY